MTAERDDVSAEPDGFDAEVDALDRELDAIGAKIKSLTAPAPSARPEGLVPAKSSAPPRRRSRQAVLRRLPRFERFETIRSRLRQ